MTSDKKTKKKPVKKVVPAIKVNQWLSGWDNISFEQEEYRRKPEPYFYMFSISASELRALCGINRRSAGKINARRNDHGIQRQHDEDRSEEISRYVEYGFPWSTISAAKRRSHDFDDLRKPGWLPTAVVINIIPAKEKRRGSEVLDTDCVTVSDTPEKCELQLPYENFKKDWRPKDLPPFEVIDGQHRLFAFDENSDHNFQVPVVAFNGLDISWQAYLFYTINIKPKKIDPSLAFDLYPLLRSEDWLDRAEGHAVYRETRSQELTESLWAHKDSPWYDRINMLGERGAIGVSQSAWIKSLMATFVKSWQGHSKKSIGGLFGSRMKNGDEVLGWSRAQQAAFLIFAWRAFHNSVAETKETWAIDLRAPISQAKNTIPGEKAFYSTYSLISTDQGVRGFLQVLNDITYTLAAKWDLGSWQVEEGSAAADEEAVSRALKTFSSHKAAEQVSNLVGVLASFDWRTSKAPNLSEELRRSKLVFRGSGGYKEIRLQLLEHIIKTAENDSEIREQATKIKRKLY